ncbi:MAG: ion transporter [Spirochaetaceae bacterium]
MKKSAGTSRFVSILENVVLIAIVLVILQSFLEDTAEILDWSWSTRRTLLYSALILDAFFSVEFLTRFYFAFVNGNAGHYIKHERGWIDLVASLPLLLLASGPQVAALLAGGAPVIGAGRTLNLLKVIKAIRIARVLRLLRALKLFRKIKHVDSIVTQKHVGRLASLTVTTLVSVLMLFSIIDILADLPGVERTFREQTLNVAEHISEEGLSDERSQTAIERFADYERAILVVRESGNTRYARYTDEELSRRFGPSDYTLITHDDVEVFLSMRQILRDQARDNLVYFLVIIAIIGVLLFVYAPYFCMTVSDPAYVMTRGMREPGYNLQVADTDSDVPDEITRLAVAYNEEYLPMKARNTDDDVSGDLTLESLGDLLEPS